MLIRVLSLTFRAFLIVGSKIEVIFKACVLMHKLSGWVGCIRLSGDVLYMELLAESVP